MTQMISVTLVEAAPAHQVVAALGVTAHHLAVTALPPAVTALPPAIAVLEVIAHIVTAHIVTALTVVLSQAVT